MTYDDIRFSWWDDPDDDETDDDNEAFEYEAFEYEAFEYRDVLADDEECKMCGKERGLNEQGYCSQCWQIWNS